jgi:hypothetical protein
MNARNLHWNRTINSGFKKEGRVSDCESCGFLPLPVPSRHFQALCFFTSSVPKSTLFSAHPPPCIQVDVSCVYFCW